jgi:hypothetical protein
MGRNWRSRVCWSLIGLLVLSNAAAAMPRVRSSNLRIQSALAEAASRSATFRQLIETIEATDGIVYVEDGRCRHGVRACLSLSVSSGGGYRLLRILVDGASDLVALMATIAHELRHAIELLTEPSVTTTAAALYYYLREAPTTRDAFETSAAIRTGMVVEGELENSANFVRVTK